MEEGRLLADMRVLERKVAKLEKYAHGLEERLKQAKSEQEVVQSGMRREARLADSGATQWRDYGCVTLRHAAILCVRDYCGFLRDGESRKVCVRDASTPDSLFRLTVTAQLIYEVEGLRGGE